MLNLKYKMDTVYQVSFINHHHDFQLLFQVQLVQESSLNFQYDAVFDLENVANTEFTAQFRGFIYPLGAVSSNGPPLKLQLISVAADMEFFLSTDETEENAVSV